jgi:glycine/D-amino acid oxidase-like deaminating enzyme
VRRGWSVQLPQPLARVHVSEARIIRRVVGLRPYRPAGFLVGTERLGDKLIVHDYGHGGGGISLSWGTAQLAVEMVDADVRSGPRRAAIIGCGVVGLSTARLLQRRGWQVTIYARDLPPNTTSNAAIGQWAPSSVFEDDGVTPGFIDQFKRASLLAYREFQNLVGREYGVRWLDNYFPGDDPPAPLEPLSLPSLLPEVFASSVLLEGREHPFAPRYCFRTTFMQIEPATYLNALLRDVRIAGATVVVREFADRQQVADLPEPVIMNCTGLGTRGLFGDETLIPAKGQLTVLQPQPEVDYAVNYSGVGMWPRTDGILLSGTFQRNEWSLEPDLDEEQRILDGNRRVFDEMRT